MKIGSFCTGYGGLDLAVEQVFGAETAWVSDIDKGACKILAHRYPDVPNLGDMTALYWGDVPTVDIVTAGYPCQPFSHAGNRKGTNDDRHLWPHIREAIRYLRPRLTVLENVAGHRSLGFHRVLGDMAEDGMHVWWASLRAADVGAPHGRERLFIMATPANGPWVGGDRRAHGGSGELGQTAAGAEQSLTLLPTPAVNDMGAGKTVDDWDAWTDRMKVAHGNGNGHGKSLSIEAQRLSKPHQQTALSAEVWNRFGDYAPAIARWENILGRPAPAPTQPTGEAGAPQLAPAFVEWMMGLPAGHVTDVPALSRVEALKALGNGVVPQQAAAALHHMLGAA